MPTKTTIKNVNALHVITMTVGVIFGLSGINHGFFEFLQGNNPTGGLLIHAIGDAQKFWPEGTEDAFTVLPTFMISGILSMIVGLAIIVWSIRFLRTRYGSTVFLGLFILLFLFGGGIGQVAFFLPAWAFATRMNKPLIWWNRVLPEEIRPFLSRAWVFLLAAATLCALIGVEIAVFGLFPGLTETEEIHNTAMLFILLSVLLFTSAYIAGTGHELYRRKHTFQMEARYA